MHGGGVAETSFDGSISAIPGGIRGGIGMGQR
jgi:hypothetical protein